MRITELDLQIEDLDIVSNYFDLSDDIISEVEIVVGVFEDYPDEKFKKDCINVSQKGLFCYDVSDENEPKNEYKLLCRPNNALKLRDLPERIQNIIKQYRLDDVCFGDSEYVRVINALKYS